MENPDTMYSPEKGKEQISLSDEQKDIIRGITLGIEEVDPSIREMANEDVLDTLENGHPLNRIITNKEGNTTGYIAFEDFVPHEAYIKYLGTVGNTDRNLLKEIPAFLEYARKQGYNKLNFHGWNKRLNLIMQRYGFERLRTDEMGDIAVDFYEKSLVEEQKTDKDISEERKQAFEKKYIDKLNQKYKQTTNAFSEDTRQEKEKNVTDAFEELEKRLKEKEDIDFSDRQKIVLKLKLARHFQNNDTCDTNTLFDAIIESPKFINTDKGSLHRLLEVHQEKTVQKIAELRKKRAEMKGDESFNPYENLFTTESGEYYMARLLNMPHLEEESEYMNNCVGTSDSYVNKIKNGYIEILSFRSVPKMNKETGKMEGDEPILTIEYNLGTNTIVQMKEYDDKYLSPLSPYFEDAIDALKKLKETRTDTGKLRNFREISRSELENIEVQNFHIFTENGEVFFEDFDPDSGDFILKIGLLEITAETSKENAAKMMRIVEGIEVAPNEISYGLDEINENTKAYIGDWNPTIFQTIKQYPNIKHLYSSFPEEPEEKIFMQTLETDTNINSPETAKEALAAKNIYVYEEMLHKTEFSKETRVYELVQFTVGQLGFSNSATTDEIYAQAKELGLELCPAEVGPQLRLQYEGKDWKYIAMEQILDRVGDPLVWYLDALGVGLQLDGYRAHSAHRWSTGDRFVFRFRPSTTQSTTRQAN